MKKFSKVRLQRIALVVFIVMVLSSFGNIALAESTLPIDTGLERLPISGGEETVMPMDISFDTARWGNLTKSTTVMSSPYDSRSASTGYTLSAGTSVYAMGRVYEYFYVGWYIGQKMMHGYVPLSSLSITEYAWVNYDIYRPGKCTATTPVLSGAGTTNTYFKVGEIYSDESPLLVLGQTKNTYNNKYYYYVQYHTSAGLIKRGWIDVSLGTVSVVTKSSGGYFSSTRPFTFTNVATGKVLTWDDSASGNNVEQRTASGDLNQFFYLEDVCYPENPFAKTGYKRIVSLKDPTMVLTVEEKGYAEGLSLIMASKGAVDKRQEFRFQVVIGSNGKDIYTALYTRSSGEYRVVEVYGGSAAEGQDIIHSKYVGEKNQFWTTARVSAEWTGDYGVNGNNASVKNRIVCVDTNSDILNYLSLSDIQSCVSSWNKIASLYNSYNLNLTVVSGARPAASNRLATITIGELETDNAVGICLGEYYSSTEKRGIPYSESEASKHSNEDWFSTTIILDIDALNAAGFTKEDMKATLCHELGHSLKLSHTYSRLEMANGEVKWIIYSRPVSIMSQGKKSVKGTTSPIAIDAYRVLKKWGS